MFTDALILFITDKNDQKEYDSLVAKKKSEDD